MDRKLSADREGNGMKKYGELLDGGRVTLSFRSLSAEGGCRF